MTATYTIPDILTFSKIRYSTSCTGITSWITTCPSLPSLVSLVSLLTIRQSNVSVEDDSDCSNLYFFVVVGDVLTEAQREYDHEKLQRMHTNILMFTGASRSPIGGHASPNVPRNFLVCKKSILGQIGRLDLGL